MTPEDQYQSAAQPLLTCDGHFSFFYPGGLFMNQRTPKVVAFAIVALATTMSLAAPTVAQATTFDFESLAIAPSTTSVTQTVGGLTMTVHRFDMNPISLTDLMGTPPAFGHRTVGNFVSPNGPNPVMVFSFSAPLVAMAISFGDFGGDDDGTVRMTPFVGPDATGLSGSGAATVYPASLDFSVQGDGAIRTLGGVSVGDATFQSFVMTSQGLFPESLFFDNVTVTAVPEPVSMVLIGTGLAGLGLRRRGA